MLFETVFFAGRYQTSHCLQLSSAWQLASVKTHMGEWKSDAWVMIRYTMAVRNPPKARAIGGTGVTITAAGVTAGVTIVTVPCYCFFTGRPVNASSSILRAVPIFRESFAVSTNGSAGVALTHFRRLLAAVPEHVALVAIGGSVSLDLLAETSIGRSAPRQWLPAELTRLRSALALDDGAAFTNYSDTPASETRSK